MILDYKDINDLNNIQIMSGTVIPRPIVIVRDDDGVLNAAPFSYFIPISSIQQLWNCCNWAKR